MAFQLPFLQYALRNTGEAPAVFAVVLFQQSVGQFCKVFQPACVGTNGWHSSLSCAVGNVGYVDVDVGSTQLRTVRFVA